MISRRTLLGTGLGLAAAAAGCSLPTSSAAPGRAPGIVIGYWPTWYPDAIRLPDLPPQYTAVNLFAATPAGEPGEVGWEAPGDGRGAAINLRADIARARREQGRSVLLSVGGAGAGIRFDSRPVSSRFVDSVRRIVDELGPLDGLDLNTFEDGLTPNPAEYAWISTALKNVYGAGFLITSPPAPWRAEDRGFCAEMVRSGLMDLCGPQYYDGPDLTDRAYVVASVEEWAAAVGAEHLVVGFGIVAGRPYFSTPEDCAETWRAVVDVVPGLRGVFCWDVGADEATGWRFARDVGGLVLGGSS